MSYCRHLLVLRKFRQISHQSKSVFVCCIGCIGLPAHHTHSYVIIGHDELQRQLPASSAIAGSPEPKLPVDLSIAANVRAGVVDLGPAAKTE